MEEKNINELFTKKEENKEELLEKVIKKVLHDLRKIKGDDNYVPSWKEFEDHLEEEHEKKDMKLLKKGVTHEEIKKEFLKQISSIKNERKKVKKEVLDNFILSEQENQKNTAKNLKKDIPYLTDFNLNSSNNNKWVFYREYDDVNKLWIIIEKNKGKKEWRLRVEAEAKLEISFKMTIAKSNDYNIFIEASNRKLENNPIFNIKNYNIYLERSEKQEMEKLLDIVKERKSEVKKLKSVRFNELRKIIKIIEKHNGEVHKKFEDIYDDLIKEYKLRTTILFALNLVHAIDYHQEMEDFYMNPRSNIKGLEI